MHLPKCDCIHQGVDCRATGQGRDPETTRSRVCAIPPKSNSYSSVGRDQSACFISEHACSISRQMASLTANSCLLLASHKLGSIIGFDERRIVAREIGTRLANCPCN